jgi:hypothetical protein
VRFWIANPELRENEVIRLQVRGSRFSGKRKVGGQIVVTDHRFIFIPTLLDKIFRALVVEFKLSTIQNVRIIPGGRAAAKIRGLGAIWHDQVEINFTGTTVVVLVREPQVLTSNLTNL